jgi:lipopolysaccharide/colanic/teichoic acid biosynthesis glycosyltransferase
MKSFVLKIGRSTKGGSLPGNVGRRRFTKSFLRYFSREELAGGRVIESVSKNGDLPAVLEKAIVDLVSSERATSPGSDSHVGALGSNPILGIPLWKRILDVTCILLTLPCWLPVMVLVTAWVRVASRGPIFYRQQRIGYRRERFMIFKFRTMYVNAETRTHEEYFAHLIRADCPMEKLDESGDSRLIPCGRFLRVSGLDELPQLFNVLWGEMSLVGPRPCLPNEFQRYEVWQQARVDVLPGLTGFWQVGGKNKTTFSEMIAMDLFYARNMSLWLDLKIILKTIPALLTQALEARRTSRGKSYGQVVHRTSAMTGSLNGAAKKI